MPRKPVNSKASAPFVAPVDKIAAPVNAEGVGDPAVGVTLAFKYVVNADTLAEARTLVPAAAVADAIADPTEALSAAF